MISQNCIGLLLFIRVIHIHPLPIAGSVSGLGSRMVVSLCLALCVNGCGVLGIIGRSLVIQGEQRLQKVTCRLEGPKLQEGVKRLATLMPPGNLLECLRETELLNSTTSKYLKILKSSQTLLLKGQMLVQTVSLSHYIGGSITRFAIGSAIYRTNVVNSSSETLC